MIITINDITKAIDNKFKKVDLDFSKIFDKVVHSWLLYISYTTME